MLVGVILHSFNEDRDYYVSVEEIKAIEQANKAKLRKAKAQQGNIPEGDDNMEADYAR